MLPHLKKLLLASLPPGVAGRLRAWRVRRLVSAYAPRDVTHTFGPVTLTVHLSDPLAEGWYDHDWADLPEIARMRLARLKPGATVFDLGAHQAVVALMLANEVGPAGKVIAVEPSPHNVAAAEANKALNAASNLTVVRAAVADTPGTLFFNESLNGQVDDGTGAGGKFQVDAVTIDGLAEKFGQPDVLFVDIEGVECLALTGAAKVLAARPDCFVEVHVGCGLEKFGGSPEQVFAHFPPAVYDRYVACDATPEFRPLVGYEAMLKERFFLVALAK